MGPFQIVVTSAVLVALDLSVTIAVVTKYHVGYRPIGSIEVVWLVGADLKTTNDIKCVRVENEIAVILQECFTRNVINGRKLVLLEISNLPKIGITDYVHAKVRSIPVEKFGRQPLIFSNTSHAETQALDIKCLFIVWQEISQSIRELLRQPTPDYWHTISTPERDRLGLFLVTKARTGSFPDGLTYGKFLKENHKKFNRLYWRDEEQDSDF